MFMAPVLFVVRWNVVNGKAGPFHTKSSLSIALMCGKIRRILVGASSNQRPEKGGLIPL